MPLKQSIKRVASFKGINNVLRPEDTDKDYLKKANNVNIDKKGKVSTRKGYSMVDSGNYTSIWSNGYKCYAVKDGDLVEILPDYSINTIKTNVGYTPISFEEVNGLVYYTSVETNGIIDGSSVTPWGIPIPNTRLHLSKSGGVLAEGYYQVSYTYVNADGLESGSSSASTIRAPDKSGIFLRVPVPYNQPNLKARVYCSTLNGLTLFYAGTTTPGDSFNIRDTSKLSNPLKMFNLDAPPPGSIVRYYKGRLYITDGYTLWYSEPNQYQHFRLDSNYIDLPENITEVVPVEDGIWICTTSSIYYLSGTGPEVFKMSLKERAVAVPGTAVRFSGSYIQLDNTPIGYKWMITTDLGVFVLFNKGLIINITATNVSLEKGSKGTAIFLQDGGTNQYLSTLEKENKPNNSVFGDIVTTTVVRNGITIQE